MAKPIPEHELGTIVSLIDEHPEGVGVAKIREGFDVPLPPRTLQRRLKHLISTGRITAEGSGKGKRYFPIQLGYRYQGFGYDNDDHEIGEAFVVREDELPYNVEKKTPPKTTGLIELSTEAREIKEIVSSPVAARTPVGYNLDFLEDYIPNKTAYLSEEIREKLAGMAKVGMSDLPAGTYLRQVLDRLIIDLSWNSSRLEGNTYSLLETQRLIALGEMADGKKVQETQMILNHKAALEMLADEAGQIAYNSYTICNLHALLSENLLQDLNACGRVRSVRVGIGGSVYLPLEVPQLIEEAFFMILEKAEVIEDPFEQAFFIMVHLPYLQPFEDVNKRVSRLAANIPLIKQNLCPLSFMDVPQEDYIYGLLGVYELNRIDYLRDVFVWAYSRSASRYAAVVQTIGEPDPFRLRYRNQIKEVVSEVVLEKMNQRKAIAAIASASRKLIPEDERPRFVEMVETELRSLHEGNIARFRLRPSQFEEWQEGWV